MAAASKRLQTEAARWFMRMHKAEPDHPDRARFEAWLLAHPAHANEYAAFADTWDDFATTPKLQSLAVRMERRKTQLAEHRNFLVKQARRSVLGLLLLVTGGIFSHQLWRAEQEQPLMELASATGVGEIGRQTLDDGTKLVLNADTRINVTYYRDRREIVLERGEVIFDVTRDPSRPFIVNSGEARVTVLGTRFAVNRLDHLVRVSVDHGRVMVESESQIKQSAGSHVIVTDGQTAEVWLGDEPELVMRNSHDAFSFESGSIVFHQAPMTEIAETLSRYRPTPVRIAQGKQIDAQVTAVLQTNNTEHFLQHLPRIAPVRVHTTSDTTWLVPR